MIIEALSKHYKKLSSQANSDIPFYGFSMANVFFAFVLSEDGDLLNVVPLAEHRGKNIIPVTLQVPQQLKRTGTGVAPNFLCDNSTYIIGADAKGKPKRSMQAFESSRELHNSILGDIDDPAARAVCKYFEKWDVEKVREHSALTTILENILAGGNIVFRLDGQLGYIHELEKIKSLWLDYREKKRSSRISQCLVTGKITPISRLHPSIKGVPGAKSSGASLVSFNLDAFTSYGKSQSYNAPVSERVTFEYTTVLNHLLSTRRQKLQLDNNTTVIFWSERRDSQGKEENLMAELLLPASANAPASDKEVDDVATMQLMRDILIRVRNGQPIDLNLTQIDINSQFAFLGISPNASRLSIRFWEQDSFGNLLERVALHHVDLSIVADTKGKEQILISVPEILIETAPLGDRKRISPHLGGEVMRAILGGQAYPQSLYTAIIARIRADKKVNHTRAAVLKACLIRKYRLQGQNNKEVNVTVSLNEENMSTAYNLGRLFAVLEKAQKGANQSITASIRDRYFGAASATPKSIFPILLRLAQHHISKAEYGFDSDRRIETIMARIKEFPSHLNLDEQGQFMLGYYHQRQAFYQKSSEKEGLV